MAVEIYLVRFTHITQMGNLAMPCTAEIKVQGSAARDRFIQALADRYKVEAEWEVYNVGGYLTALEKVRDHFARFPLLHYDK